MPSIKVIAMETSGIIVRVYKSQEEEALYAGLPLPGNTQPPVTIDLAENAMLAELVDGNNWHRYRVQAGALAKDGTSVTVHPNSEAENDRLALPGLFTDLRNFVQNVTPLDTSSTAAERLARTNLNTDILQKTIKALRYLARQAKVV